MFFIITTLSFSVSVRIDIRHLISSSHATSQAITRNNNNNNNNNNNIVQYTHDAIVNYNSSSKKYNYYIIEYDRERDHRCHYWQEDQR